MLVKIGDDTWINPSSVNYVYKNSDGDTVIGCGDEHFAIYKHSIDEVIEIINDAIAASHV